MFAFVRCRQCRGPVHRAPEARTERMVVSAAAQLDGVTVAGNAGLRIATGVLGSPPVGSWLIVASRDSFGSMGV